MEEERKSEVPCGEKCSENTDRETTPKCEQLASATTVEDFNNSEEASLPPVEARGLAGDTLVLEGCRTVGSIMAKIAIARDRIADRVIVMDQKDGRKMAAGDHVVPVVEFVIINEEDAVVDNDSTLGNLLLHAQQGDRETCSRLRDVLDIPRQGLFGIAPFPPAPGAESILRDIVTRQDADWKTSLKTLIQAGVPAGPAFLEAARIGFVDCVTFLLSVQPSLIGFIDEAVIGFPPFQHGPLDTALTLAACAGGRHGWFDKSFGRRIHSEAADEGHDDVVAKLLAAAANVNHANSSGYTPLIIASDQGRSDIVAKLLAAGANVDPVHSGSNTALICAARCGHDDVVVKLLAAGANVDQANSNGDTPLIYAAHEHDTRYGKRFYDVVVKLLEAGAKLEPANANRDTALIFAGDADVVAQLLAAGANVNHANSMGNTSLIMAAGEGRKDIVAKLVAGGANVNLANSSGDTALAVATSRGCADVVAKLLAAGAEIKQMVKSLPLRGRSCSRSKKTQRR